MKMIRLLTPIFFCLSLTMQGQNLTTSGFNPIYFENASDEFSSYNSIGELLIRNTEQVNEGLLQYTDAGAITSNDYATDISQTFDAFPNPTNDQLFIYSEIEYTNYILYDMRGAIIQIGLLDQETTMISILNLPSGPYFLQLNNSQIKSEILKVIKP